MKRLLAQIGITYFSVLAVAFYLSELAVAILTAAALISSVLLLIFRKPRKTIYIPAMAIAALVACLVNLGYTFRYVKPLVEKYAGAEHRIEAVISDEPYRSYSKVCYPLEVKTVDGEKARFRLLLRCRHALEADPDDTLIFTASLSENESDYYRSHRYYLSVNEYHVTAEIQEAESHTLYYYMIRLREALRSGLNRSLPADCAALCRAVFIGDRYVLDTDTRESFQYAGASYFIVVSGMHFAVLCGLMQRLLRLLRNRWVSLALILIFILSYMAVTGFRPSVLRAGVMMLVYVIGVTVRRQTYAPNHLGLAGILLPFFISPYGAGDIGLILSYYATLSILLWATPIMGKISSKDEQGAILRFHPAARLQAIWKRLRSRKKQKEPSKPKAGASPVLWLKKLWKMFAAVLAAGLAVNILIFPISVFFFRGFSVVTLLSSVLLYYWIYLILLLSMAVALLFPLGPLRLLTIPLAWVLTGICRLVLWIVRLLADLPFSYVHMRQDYLLVCLGVTVLLFAAAFLYKADIRRTVRYAALGSAMVFLTGAVLHTALNINTVRLRVFESDAGVCAGVESRGRFYLLSADCSSQSLYAALRKIGDDYGGAQVAVCEDNDALERLARYSDREFAISAYLLYDKHIDDPHVYPVTDGSVFLLDDDLTLTAAVSGGHAILSLTAGERSVLILPRDCSLADIPDGLRAPDVLLLSAPFNGADALTCTDLIVGGNRLYALSAVEALADRYDNVYLTFEGEVNYNLR